MTLNELKYILAVARHEHFGKAAEECHISQPSLSIAIKKLEDELNVQIFERGKRNVTVTPEGEPLIHQAQKVLEEADKLKQLSMHRKDPLDGPLRMGAIFTIGPYLFPDLVPSIHRSLPQMPLFIEEDFTENLIAKLRRSELDVIVIALPIKEEGLQTLALYDEEFVAVFPDNHEWEERGAITTSEVSGQPLLLLGPGNCLRDQIMEACPNCQPPQPGQERWMEGSSLETIRYMIAQGFGVSVMPVTALAAAQDYPGLDTRPFAAPQPKRRVALAWRKSFPRKAAVETLGTEIRKVMEGRVELVEE